MIAVGFFSQDCIECGDSVIAPYDMPVLLEWQNSAVCITPRGSILIGEYDGYGRVDGHEQAIWADNTVYHLRCWEAAGRPLEYRGPSLPSDDQGYFYDRTGRRLCVPRVSTA